MNLTYSRLKRGGGVVEEDRVEKGVAGAEGGIGGGGSGRKKGLGGEQRKKQKGFWK